MTDAMLVAGCGIWLLIVGCAVLKWDRLSFAPRSLGWAGLWAGASVVAGAAILSGQAAPLALKIVGAAVAIGACLAAADQAGRALRSEARP